MSSSENTLPKIVNVEPIGRQELVLTYNSGEKVVVDFSEVIANGGVFSYLRDPSFFAQVAISEDGRYIIWPGEIDFCADALLEQGKSVQVKA